MTLLGPGGAGKTRLAAEIARTTPRSVFVDLEGCATEAAVAAAVGGAIGADAPLLDPNNMWVNCPEGLTPLECDPPGACGWFRQRDDDGQLAADVPIVQGVLRGAYDVDADRCDMELQVQFANGESYESAVAVVTNSGTPPWCLQ